MRNTWKKRFFTLKFDHQLIELTRLHEHDTEELVWLMTEQSRLDLMVLMLNEQHALGQLYTHSKGKVMQQNVYKAQWKITWYNIDETFNITATVQNEKRTCKKSVSDFLHCLPTFLNVCYIITLTNETFF